MSTTQQSAKMPRRISLKSSTIELKLKNAVPLIYLAFVTVWLRLINLGYSDYQGDEIKALYRPQVGQGLVEFLLSQRKGPLQFLITYVMRIFNPSYSNEFLMRLPFAVAGILAVYFFYKFARLQFGKQIALYSAFFVATNGLFVAFSRIIQYQPFVVLFSVIALYLLVLSTKYNRWRIYGLYLGMCFWGISILAHYDGVFIAPFVFYILHNWYFDNSSSLSKPARIKHLVLAIGIFLLMMAVFYIPFFLSVSESTQAYWLKRVTKKSGGNSISTFTTYNPTITIYIYLLLGLFSLSKIKEKLPLLMWFLLPLFFMEVLMRRPGTHIYTYILPLCILISYGLEELKAFTKRRFKKNFSFINNSFIVIMLIFIFLVSNAIFIDHKKEYQWETKNFLVWSFPRKYRQSLFGFPYYRHWEEIGTYLKTAPGNNRYYISNEKSTITRYYVPGDFKNLKLEPPPDKPDEYVYVIYVKNPQSRVDTIIGKEPSYLEARHKPLKTFLNSDRAIAQVYRLSASDYKKIQQ